MISFMALLFLDIYVSVIFLFQQQDVKNQEL